MDNNTEFQKIEKTLKGIDLPDFEITQHRRILRRALLNSPYFDQKKGILSVFASILAPMSAVGIIVLFIFLGYPYLHYFYSGAQAKCIVNKLDNAITNLEPNRTIYAVLSDKENSNPEFGKLQDIPENKLSTIKESLTQGTPDLAALPSNQNNQQRIKKIDFNPGQIKDAKYLQYVGEEKVDDSTVKKIRYTNQAGDLITEIDIESKTNLPVKIDSWKPLENIKSPTMLTDPKVFLSEDLERAGRSTMFIRITNDDFKNSKGESQPSESTNPEQSPSEPSPSPSPHGD